MTSPTIQTAHVTRTWGPYQGKKVLRNRGERREKKEQRARTIVHIDDRKEKSACKERGSTPYIRVLRNGAS